jgi:hypothetical protein
VDVTMILCDAADEVGGKLYILGGGWTHLLTPNTPVSMALGVVVAVPWTRTNERHPLTVRLLDEDGTLIETAEGQQVQTGGQMEVGRPPGVKPGSAINAVMAFKFNGLALDARGYVWELRVADVEARTPFWVVDPAKVGL